DGVDPLRLVEGVVESVAAGRGDHQQAVAGPQLEGHPVEAGILPAGVVNQVLAVAEFKKSLANGGRKHARFLKGTRLCQCRLESLRGGAICVPSLVVVARRVTPDSSRPPIVSAWGVVGKGEIRAKAADRDTFRRE